MLALLVQDWPAHAPGSPRPWRGQQSEWLDARYSGGPHLGAGRSGLRPGRAAAQARRQALEGKVLKVLGQAAAAAASARAAPAPASPYLRRLLGDALGYAQYLDTLERMQQGGADLRFFSADGSSLEPRSIKDAFGAPWFWSQHLQQLR